MSRGNLPNKNNMPGIKEGPIRPTPPRIAAHRHQQNARPRNPDPRIVYPPDADGHALHHPDDAADQPIGTAIDSASRNDEEAEPTGLLTPESIDSNQEDRDGVNESSLNASSNLDKQPATKRKIIRATGHRSRSSSPKTRSTSGESTSPISDKEFSGRITRSASKRKTLEFDNDTTGNPTTPPPTKKRSSDSEDSQPEAPAKSSTETHAATTTTPSPSRGQRPSDEPSDPISDSGVDMPNKKRLRKSRRGGRGGRKHK